MGQLVTNGSGVFDSSLLIRHDVGEMPNLNASFIGQTRYKAHVASQLFIYDQLVIPTHDYGVVAALVNWFGKEVFLEALESGAFLFLRTKGLLGYAGNGAGIEITIPNFEHHVSPGNNARAADLAPG